MKVTSQRLRLFSSAWLPKCRCFNVQLAEITKQNPGIIEFFPETTEEIRELARDLMNTANELDQNRFEEYQKETRDGREP